MNSSFTQTFLVTPVRQGVGLTSAALGIVRALQRLGVAVGFDDSYGTARRVSHIPTTVPKDDIARMNAVLDCVAEHLDAATISAAFHLRENTKLSPRPSAINSSRRRGPRKSVSS